MQFAEGREDTRVTVSYQAEEQHGDDRARPADPNKTRVIGTTGILQRFLQADLRIWNTVGKNQQMSLLTQHQVRRRRCCLLVIESLLHPVEPLEPYRNPGQ